MNYQVIETSTTIFRLNLSCVGPTKKRAGVRVNGRLVRRSRNPVDVKNDQSGRSIFSSSGFGTFDATKVHGLFSFNFYHFV